jgi:hypothetical protein
MLEDARGWAIFLVQPTCKTIGSKGYDRETIFTQLALFAFCCIASLRPVFSFVQSGKPSKVHTYYIAADEGEWDYAPHGIDKVMGTDFGGWGKMGMDVVRSG